MSLLLGIDLGTSSVKCMLAADDGRIIKMAEQEYPILAPAPNWSEQDPESWWQKTVLAIQQLLEGSGIDKNAIKAIGLSGQMHGTVFLDKENEIIRPAIIWSDQRSSAQCQTVYQRMGYERLAQIAGSGVFPGFMLASLLWIQEHEPDIWKKIGHVTFPKDYIRFRLTSEVATDISDASSGLLVDIRKRSWSDELVDQFSIPHEILPRIFESYEIAGVLKKEVAEILGLNPGTTIIAGASDQATGLLGCGIVSPKILTATIGTGGQLVTLLPEARADEQLRTHTFCHALPDSWYLLGATLSAGLVFRWLRDAILQEKPDGGYTRMTKLAHTAPPGSEGLIFLPYLVGERIAKQTAQPTGVFYGLNIRHNRSHMIRAVMEGIVFSLRQVLDVFKTLEVDPEQIVISGGGARSDLWCQMTADIFQTPVSRLIVQEQSAVGAIILAGLGMGYYRDAAEACQTFVQYEPPVMPQLKTEPVYSELYQRFIDLNQSTRGIS